MMQGCSQCVLLSEAIGGDATVVDFRVPVGACVALEAELTYFCRLFPFHPSPTLEETSHALTRPPLTFLADP
jgi:hypothetical protein